MNQGKYIFAQLAEFQPRRVFDRIVKTHEGNKYVRSFNCWNQMLCMVFGQLTSRDSMRDLMLSLEAHQSKYYHLGFGQTVTRRNLGKANEKRSYKIFNEFTCILIDQVRKSCCKTDFEVEVDGNVYALDSTIIDLCLSVFWWAEFRKHIGGTKLHTLYDVKTSIPGFCKFQRPVSMMSISSVSFPMKSEASMWQTMGILILPVCTRFTHTDHFSSQEPKTTFDLKGCIPAWLTKPKPVY